MFLVEDRITFPSNDHINMFMYGFITSKSINCG